MCWITLTPKSKSKHHHHDGRHSEDGSSVEELVRVHKSVHKPRYSKVSIVTPDLSTIDSISEKHFHHHHHKPDSPKLLHHHHPHLHPHIHPLHMHPLLPHHYQHHTRMHGPGRKRAPSPATPAAPPSSREPSRQREPMYKTQIVEPPIREREVRETTRIALREVRPGVPRSARLRRVAGYEVLGREVPWQWECVSSVGSSGGEERERGRGRSRLKYPPFAGMGSWM